MASAPQRQRRCWVLGIRYWELPALALLISLVAVPASAANIRDIAHLQGARENKLKGLGLVVGLKGTGDGSKNVQSLRTLAALLESMGSSVPDLRAINADNVALVEMTATIPDSGAREGEKLDVHLAAVNGAKSLRGGRLVLCPMLGPAPRSTTVFALAEGALTLEDESQTTTAVVAGGAILERRRHPQLHR